MKTTHPRPPHPVGSRLLLFEGCVDNGRNTHRSGAVVGRGPGPLPGAVDGRRPWCRTGRKNPGRRLLRRRSTAPTGGGTVLGPLATGPRPSPIALVTLDERDRLAEQAPVHQREAADVDEAADHREHGEPNGGRQTSE